MLKKSLFIVGLVVCALASVTIALAQGTQPPAPTYVGSDKCVVCHKPIHESWAATLHSKMIQDPARDPKSLLADLSKMSVVITDTRLQYKKSDVVLVMGWRYRQRYILADPQTGRLVMGAGQWKLAGREPSGSDGTWQAATAGEDWLTECAGCHTTGFNLDKSLKYTAADYKAGKDKPFVELGIGCEACHGPGSEHSKTPTKGNIPVNKAKALDAQICGACHARGVSQDDKGGTHQYPLGYVPGGNLSQANWTPLKATGSITDAHWYADGNAKSNYQQYLEWLPSGHAAALDTLKKADGTDACVMCHSAEGALAPQGQTVKLADAKYGLTCQVCHASHKAGAQLFDELLRHDVYEGCTICHSGTNSGKTPIKAGQRAHAPMREMYEGKGAVDIDGKPSPHLAAKDDRATCVSCHMPGMAKSVDTGDVAAHNWKIALPGQTEKAQPNACRACHINTASKAPQMTLASLQKTIDDRQQEITLRWDGLSARLDRLSDKNLGWTDAETRLPAEPAPARFKAAFTNLSFVQADGSKGIHNFDYAQAVLDQVENDLQSLEQPPTPMPTRMPTSTPEPTWTPAPTATPADEAAPPTAGATNWVLWLVLGTIVIVVLVLLTTRHSSES